MTAQIALYNFQVQIDFLDVDVESDMMLCVRPLLAVVRPALYKDAAPAARYALLSLSAARAEVLVLARRVERVRGVVVIMY